MKLYEAKIKSDPNYFFRYAKNCVCVCVSNTGPLYDKKRNLLTSDILEMCIILPEQFNSVLLRPSQTSM